MNELTPLQQHYIEVANLALVIGTVAAGMIIFLLAMIAVSLLRSR